MDRNLDCAPTNSAAAFVISDFTKPATFDSMTSRDSSEASALASSAESILPSMYPPLSTRVGNLLAASTTDFAAATGSPATNATAEGPSSNASSSARPASFTARRIKVFLTTANFVPPPARDRRSSPISDTVRPRYSVSRRASDPSIRAFSSATRSTFCCLGIAPPDMKQRASADSGDAHRQAALLPFASAGGPVSGLRARAPLLSVAREGYGAHADGDTDPRRRVAAQLSL